MADYVVPVIFIVEGRAIIYRDGDNVTSYFNIDNAIEKIIQI